jgi:hypothetical protein
VADGKPPGALRRGLPKGRSLCKLRLRGGFSLQMQSRSWSGFGAIAGAIALMKLEPEVIVDPKGETVNLSLVQPSLGSC